MNKGFASVYVVISMMALMLFLLCVLELCGGHAAGSICENICLIAGDSVLSEFQPDLYRRYGVFALSSHEQKLEPMSRFYITNNLNGVHLLVRPKLMTCTVNTADFSGLDTQVLAEQIDALGLMCLGREALDELGAWELLKRLLNPLENRDDEDALQELDNLPQEEGEDAGSIDSLRDLKKAYKEAMKEDMDAEEGKSLVSVDKDALPTSLLGVRPSSSLLGYAASALMSGSPPSGAVLQSFYICSCCSCKTNERDDTVLGLEVEYILFGRSSDRENEKEMKVALFKVRTALDLVNNLRNEEKRAAYSAAAAAFPEIPQPLVVLILAGIDAALQAKDEIGILCAGGCAEIIPGLRIGDRKFGTYKDHAALLLMILPQQTRMARLMDVMQINVAYMDAKTFAFRDYCYGFALTAEFEKDTILFAYAGDARKGTVEQIHAYH